MAVYCHSAYVTYMQSTSCKMPSWMKHKLESRLPREISITSDMQMTPPLWQKTKIMASGSISLWQIDGGKVETLTDFIFLDSKITVDGDFSHKIKRCLLLGRKAIT